MANAFIFSHPQRTEIKKAADESQSILEKTPVGTGNDDGSLRAFLKVHIAFTMSQSMLRSLISYTLVHVTASGQEVKAVIEPSRLP